jgi:hypothetical protein
MRHRVIDSISRVDSTQWNSLSLGDYPFLRHEFLQALEQHGSATAATGWRPHHLIFEDKDGRLMAAAPLYLKSHSYGEFVFDFAWAEASHRIGHQYYPKLLNAVPFNPVTGPRLLASNDGSRAALATSVRREAETLGISSAHALFLNDADRAAYVDAGFLLRKDCHFHWLNPGYRDFDDYLDGLPARRRKEIRRERRKVSEAGISFDIVRGNEITDELWPTVYACYARTYQLRGQPPYLSQSCLRAISARLPEVLFFIARRNGKIIAIAYTLASGDTLYGRHWGCIEEHPCLHFEACYYQGIEHCIAHQIARFDAGAQGEHKLQRGFEPVATWSAHWLAEPRLRKAIANYLDRETAAIDDYIEMAVEKNRN